MLRPKWCIIRVSIIMLPTFWSTYDPLKCCLLSSLINLPQTITPAITAWFRRHLNLTSEVCLQKHLYDAGKTSADISTQTPNESSSNTLHSINTLTRSAQTSEETCVRMFLRRKQNSSQTFDVIWDSSVLQSEREDLHFLEHNASTSLEVLNHRH